MSCDKSIKGETWTHTSLRILDFKSHIELSQLGPPNDLYQQRSTACTLNCIKSKVILADVACSKFHLAALADEFPFRYFAEAWSDLPSHIREPFPCYSMHNAIGLIEQNSPSLIIRTVTPYRYKCLFQSWPACIPSLSRFDRKCVGCLYDARDRAVKKF